ncbi:MAG: Flp pilus assembly complex ATPase component TadA [Bacteroidales bacterium]|nr:Flp pilus assembly complex ATPase component TadA [Bacteroidales bacterium]
MSNTVKIKCLNTGTTLLLPKGTTLAEIRDILRENGQLAIEPLAAKVNNRITSLNWEIYHPKNVEFIDLSDSAGMRVYVRTLTFLISAAVTELYPEGSFRLEHSVSNGYYCLIENGHPVTEQELDAIKRRTRELIEADLPIEYVEEETDVLTEKFRQANRPDIVRLLSNYNHTYACYSKMGEHIDYYYGPLCASSRAVGLFDIIPLTDGGFLLQAPDPKDPGHLAPFVAQPKLLNAFKTFIHWNRINSLSNIGDLNLAVKEGRASHIINVSEALQEKKIAQMADEILSQADKKKIILVAGPSSSGKTTFSKRLAVQLAASGAFPIPLSLDDYFLEREQSPRDENGNYDYEALYALDLELFNNQLIDLLDGKAVKIPRYNFSTGHKEFSDDRTIQLNDDNILILEGIHALNPKLLPKIPARVQYKIYVSALTSISLDNHNRISTADNRLIRRMIRDAQYRSIPARETISRWPSVRAGEDKWIFPYQENADAVFNSALLYELSVLKQFAEPLLLSVPQTCPEYTEAWRLLCFLDYLQPIGGMQIPPTSLLREFVGGSSFNY